MSVPVHVSLKGERTADQPISYFMQQAVENPRLISLAAGLVDAESLPAVEVAAAASAVLRDPSRAQAALQYGTTQGYLQLRQVLLERTFRLDGKSPAELNLTADDCIITTGSQQLLYLVSEALLDPGDIVITAAPSYFVYHGTLQSMGVRTLCVPSDSAGLDTDLLAELLGSMEAEELARLRLIYVVDYFDNPTGSTLSMERRRHLLDLVRRYSMDHRILIVEDAAYRELRYDGTDLPSIKSLDKDNQFVILTMTFSKPCSPGLKTGYAFVPREILGPLLRLKGNHDFGSNNFTQHLLHELLVSGAYDRHVAELRQVYRRKRDVLMEALKAEFPPSWKVSWYRPRGGLYIWGTFPGDVDTSPDGPLMNCALEEGVLYVPGCFCYVEDDKQPVPSNEVRLSFGVVDEPALREGARRLARAYARVRKRSRSTVAASSAK